LIISKTGRGKFASFKFDTTESTRNNFYLLLGIIIAVILFPLWPYQVKYWLWIVTLTVFVSLVVLLLLRVSLYVVLSTLGISFWIFPNLMGNYGLVDSFKPLYST
jgi:translocation protein SEC62